MHVPHSPHRPGRACRAGGRGLPVLQRPAHRRDDGARLPRHRRRAVLLRGAPEIALAFHRALTEDDRALTRTLLDEFYGPVPGYAVSLIRAGVTHRGLDVGGVRAT